MYSSKEVGFALLHALKTLLHSTEPLDPIELDALFEKKYTEQMRYTQRKSSISQFNSAVIPPIILERSGLFHRITTHGGQEITKNHLIFPCVYMSVLSVCIRMTSYNTGISAFHLIREYVSILLIPVVNPFPLVSFLCRMVSQTR